jgi:hypothetical protein
VEVISNVDAPRSAVRSIAWLDGRLGDSAKAGLTFLQLIRERG